MARVPWFKVATLLGHEKAVEAVAWSPAGDLIASVSRDSVRLWNPRTRTEVHRPLGAYSQDTVAIAWAPTGERFVTGSVDGTASIWCAETGALVGEALYGHTGPVNSVAWSPNGEMIATGSADRSVVVWDRSGKKIARLAPNPDSVTALAWSRNAQDQYIAVGTRFGTVQVWNATKPLPEGKIIYAHKCEVAQLAWAPDGTHIISSAVDKTVRIWDEKTSTPIKNQGEIKGEAIAYSPSGEEIATGSDNILSIWTPQGVCKQVVSSEAPYGGISSVTWSPDGRAIATGGFDFMVRIHRRVD